MRLIEDAGRAISGQSSSPAGKLARLGGSLVALVTPFRDGKLDAAALSQLCERQINRNTAALLVCGSTGEAGALSAPEHARVVAIALEAASGRVPVIAGCAASATEASTVLAAAAIRHGAAAVLCAPPPYSKPTQDGIAAHVCAVAHAADRPVILYDVPGRTGVAVADETVARLFARGLVVALKDAGGDLSRPARLRALCGDALTQYAGDDATAVAHRSMGGHGCISVTANLVPSLCARMHRAWDEGDMAELGRIRDVLSPLHHALFNESNPIPIKTALSIAGLCLGELRLPLTRARPVTIELLESLLPAVLSAEEELAQRPRFSLVT